MMTPKQAHQALKDYQAARSSTFQFGLGEGHLPKKAAKIAQKHGADLINYTEPNGHKRHWFTGPNYGDPADKQVAATVLAEIAEMRIA